jgi:hypothetical protein
MLLHTKIYHNITKLLIVNIEINITIFILINHNYLINLNRLIIKYTLILLKFIKIKDIINIITIKEIYRNRKDNKKNLNFNSKKLKISKDICLNI